MKNINYKKLMLDGKYRSLYPYCQIDVSTSFKILKESIRKNGIINPIYYLPDLKSGNVIIVDGNTRLKAARELIDEGIDIELNMQETTENKAFGIYLSCNVQNLHKRYSVIQRAFMGAYLFFNKVARTVYTQNKNLGRVRVAKKLLSRDVVAKMVGSNGKYIQFALTFLRLFSQKDKDKIFQSIFTENIKVQTPKLAVINENNKDEFLHIFNSHGFLYAYNYMINAYDESINYNIMNINIKIFDKKNNTKNNVKKNIYKKICQLLDDENIEYTIHQ